jgi:hypothetical protein
MIKWHLKWDILEMAMKKEVIFRTSDTQPSLLFHAPIDLHFDICHEILNLLRHRASIVTAASPSVLIPLIS